MYEILVKKGIKIACKLGNKRVLYFMNNFIKYHFQQFLNYNIQTTIIHAEPSISAKINLLNKQRSAK